MLNDFQEIVQIKHLHDLLKSTIEASDVHHDENRITLKVREFWDDVVLQKFNDVLQKILKIRHGFFPHDSHRRLYLYQLGCT